jgi:hypothetical protein
MVRHQVTGSSGFDSHPEIFYPKKFRGWAASLDMGSDCPNWRDIHAEET